MSEEKPNKPGEAPEELEAVAAEAASSPAPEAAAPPVAKLLAEPEVDPFFSGLGGDEAITAPSEPLPKASSAEDEKTDNDDGMGENLIISASAAATMAEADDKAPSRDKVIVLDPCRELIHGLVAMIEDKDLADIMPVSTPEEAIQAATKNLPCMLILSINTQDDVGPNYKVFTKLDSAMEHQGLKVLVVTPIKSKKLAFLFFKRFSVTEYVEEPIPPRTFQFKALQLLKAVDSFRKDEREKQHAAGAKTRPALTGVRDIFYLNRSSVKKVGKNYTIDVEGPDPASGQWVPHIDTEQEPTCWRWVPNEEFMLQKNGEIPRNGWVAYGNRPLSNDETKTWNLTAEKLLLHYQKDGAILAEKIGIQDDGFVFVAEDPKDDGVLRLKTSGKTEEAPKWRNRIGEGGPEEVVAWNNRISEGKDEAPQWNDKQAGYRPRNGTFRNLITPDAPVEKKPDLTIIKGDKQTGGVGELKHLEGRFIVRGIDFTDKKEIREIAGLKKFLDVQKLQNGQLRIPRIKKKGEAKISIYRTMLVAIADAFATVPDPKERMETILNAMETAYIPAYAVFTGLPDIEGSCSIQFRSRSAPRIGTNVAFVGGIAHPVLVAGADPGEPPIGYFFLSQMGNRETFTEEEKNALKQISARMSPLLTPKKAEKPAEEKPETTVAAKPEVNALAMLEAEKKPVAPAEEKPAAKVEPVTKAEPVTKVKAG